MPRTLGDIIPLGAGNPDDCGPDLQEKDFRLRLSEDCGKSGSAAGRLTICSDLSDAAKGVEVTAKAVDIVAGITMTLAKGELQRTTDEGTRDMRQGAAQAQENVEPYNDRIADWLGWTSEFNSYGPKLDNISNTLDRNKPVIEGLKNRVDQNKARLPQADQAIRDAEAREAAAKNRANYPRTLEGLQRQRADQQAANLAKRDANLAKVSLEQQISNDSVAHNNAVFSNNATLAEGQALAQQAAATQAQADQARADASRYEAGVRAGQQQYGNGVQKIRNGVEEFKAVRDNQVIPMVEGANSMRGVSKVINKIDQERPYSAGAEAFNSAYGTASRLTGSVPLINSTYIVSSAINATANAMEQGGDGEQQFNNFIKDFGQATVRSTDIANIAEQVELADCVASNSSNPHAAYDAMTILNSQFAPAVEVAGGIAETAAPFVPGLNMVSPIIPLVTGAVGTAGQGLLQTVTEAVNTAWDRGLSAEVGNYPPRTGPGGLTIGRPGSLVEREQGGPADPGTVLIAGLAVTIGETSRNIYNNVIGRNENNAARAQDIVTDIAKTGIPGTKPSPPLRVGEVTIRPPAATPVYAGD